VRPTLERTFRTYSTRQTRSYSIRDVTESKSNRHVLSLRTLNIRHWRHTWRVLWLFPVRAKSLVWVEPRQVENNRWTRS